MKNRRLPNNPTKAYLLGKLHGTQENMDLVAMALLDKCGFHLHSTEPGDAQSIEYLFAQLESYAAEINEGRISRRDIKKMLREDEKIIFSD